jgi:hypothetical protein
VPKSAKFFLNLIGNFPVVMWVSVL